MNDSSTFPVSSGVPSVRYEEGIGADGKPFSRFRYLDGSFRMEGEQEESHFHFVEEVVHQLTFDHLVGMK